MKIPDTLPHNIWLYLRQEGNDQMWKGVRKLLTYIKIKKLKVEKGEIWGKRYEYLTLTVKGKDFDFDWFGSCTCNHKDINNRTDFNKLMGYHHKQRLSREFMNHIKD